MSCLRYLGLLFYFLLLDLNRCTVPSDFSLLHQEIGGHRKLNELASFPIQTFFIPLQEEVIFSKMFFVVNSNRARAPIESVVSLAFSTDNTVVWYDHWEDGYDIDVTNETSSTTEIWGDGNATNGCAPIKGLSCTDATDILKAGQAIVVQNSVPLPRTSKILYDGGDRMQTSFPVTATRGAYPTVPGPLMAGAVDIVDTSNWGTFFEAPVGLDVGKTYNVFQYCGLFFMAAFDGTNVTLPDKSIITLNRGESSMVVVNQGDTLNSTDIIQVHLITGDIESYYEMRWYSILPTESCKLTAETCDSKRFTRKVRELTHIAPAVYFACLHNRVERIRYSCRRYGRQYQIVPLQSRQYQAYS